MSENNNTIASCLDWCSKHNKTTYIIYGIIIGVTLYNIYLSNNKSDNTLDNSSSLGPCLDWCFKYNRNKYISYGIIIGIISYNIYFNK